MLEVKSDLETNKEFIIKSFDIPFEGDLTSIHFEIILDNQLPTQNETHRRGKSPLKIAIKFKETTLKHIFYKPRDCRIDQYIIELFGKLNNLSHKSIDATLPVYKVFNLRSQDREFGLWEFIEGREGISETADGTISQLNLSENIQLLLQHKLKRLDQICQYLKISDLHRQNIIFRGLDTLHPEIIPIDLESIQELGEPGLYNTPPREREKVNSDEEKLLREFQETYLYPRSIPVRLVLLNTTDLKEGLSNFRLCQNLSLAIHKEMEKLGYRIPRKERELESAALERQKIEKMLLRSFINNDVPYLTEYRDKLYYEAINDSNLIGVKGWTE